MKATAKAKAQKPLTLADCINSFRGTPARKFPMVKLARSRNTDSLERLAALIAKDHKCKTWEAKSGLILHMVMSGHLERTEGITL